MQRGPISLAFSLLTVACSGRRTEPRAIEMVPIGTDVGTGRGEAADGAVTGVNSAADVVLKDECAGVELDDLTRAFVEACEATSADERTASLGDKLEARVSVSPEAVAPGGQVTLAVVLRNKTAEPLVLVFSGAPTPTFDVEARDDKGRRAGWPAGKPPKPRKARSTEALSSKLYKVTLAANGVARLSTSWDAIRTRWAPEKTQTAWSDRPFPRAPAGPLSPGRYLLRVSVPLVAERSELTALEAKVRVGK